MYTWWVIARNRDHGSTVAQIANGSSISTEPPTTVRRGLEDLLQDTVASTPIAETYLQQQVLVGALHPKSLDLQIKPTREGRDQVFEKIEPTKTPNIQHPKP